MGIINIARKFMDKMNNDNIGAFSAQASFFLFLSLFPCLILLLTLIQYTPITKAFLLETLVQIAPKNTTPVIITILDEMFNKSSTTLISFSVISALWSAGKGFFAITKGINVIYKKQENRNYFLLRLISGFYTLIFIILLVISLVLLVYGNKLHHFIAGTFPFLEGFSGWLISIRTLLVWCALMLFFLLLYNFIPSRKGRFNKHNRRHFFTFEFPKKLPGAVFASLGWMIFSYFYSLYVDNFSSMSYMYGSLTTIVVSLLWLYFIMYILFIGAEINSFIEERLNAMSNKKLL